AAPKEFLVPNRAIEDDETLEIDGVEIITREMGPSESTGATVFYLPSTRDLYAGDLVLNQMHGFLLEERSAELLASLQRLRILFPHAAALHPGHGAPGSASQLIDAQEAYVVDARDRVARAIAEGMGDEALVARVSRELLDASPEHTVPGGQPNMVELSVQGLLNELRREPIVTGGAP
ncbi:MAG: hypothetical protein MI919_22570, partial [Holophagales bacterium]|nr:hypothetical protein [Holophagales bacterium]